MTAVSPPAHGVGRRSTETAGGPSRVRAGAGILSAGGWLVVYLGVAMTGQRFSTDYLGYGWQLLPWEALSRDPLGSVLHLHIQPPLWNLVLGSAARLSPFPDAITLQAVQVVFGVALAWLLADVLARVGLGRGVATALALVATVNPEILRHGFEPTYELPTATLLVALVWAVVRLISAPTGRRLGAVAGIATAVVLTRSLYHPLWAVVVVAAAGWLAARRGLPRPGRATALVLLVPIVASGGWMLKNEVLFDRATLSSWVGMNLQRSTIPVLPAADLDRMLAEGDVSGVADIGPFEPYDRYAAVMPPCAPTRGHRAVTLEERPSSIGPTPNFNHQCFLPVFEQAGDDAWAVIREHPGIWVEGRIWAARATFAVSTSPSSSRSAPLRALDSGYRIARVEVTGTISTVGWGTPIFAEYSMDARFSLLMVALTAGLAIGAAVAAFRLATGQSTDPVWSSLVAVAGFLVIYTFLVGAVGELSEQARFRTMTDPIVLGVGMAAVVRRGLTGWRRRPPSPTVPDRQG